LKIRAAAIAALSATLLASAPGLFAASNLDLLKEAPQSSSAAIAADISKLLELPAVQDARNRDQELEKQFQELEAKLAKHNLKITDMVSNFVVFSDDIGSFGGLLASSSLGEEKLEALLKGEIFGSPTSEYSIETIAGHKTYILKGAKPKDLIPGQGKLPGSAQLDSLMKQSQEKTVALTFLSKDTLLVIGREDYEKYLAAPKGLSKDILARAATVDDKAPVWGVFSLPKKALNPSQAPNSFAEKISGVAFSINSKPIPKDDLCVKVSLECIDDASAAFAASQIQTMVMAMTFSAAQNPQSPVAELVNALILDNKGRFVTLELPISKKTLEKLNKRQQPQQAPQLQGQATPGAPFN
jgi:hypothetical protein